MSSLLLHGANLRRGFVVVGVLTLSVLSAGAVQAGEGKWGSHIELTAKAGNERNLGKLNLFAPIVQDEESLWFMDAKLVVGRGHGAGSSSVEGNLGLGYRDINRGVARDGSDDYIWGVYGYYDHIRTENHNSFNQLTLGAELFTQDWDFRINGYLPERDSEVVGSGSSSSIVVSGSNISALRTNYQAVERALPGMDMEAGYSFQLANGHRLNTHLGYFHFDRKNSPTIEGPRGRVDYVMDDVFSIKGSRLSLGLEAQSDAVRDDQYFASATIRIPLGKSPSSPRRRSSIDRRMTETIVRDVDIVTFAQDINAPAGSMFAPDVASQQTESLTNTRTGNAVDTIIYASSAGGGVGTEADPATFSTAGAVALAGDDGVIVLLDSANIGGSSITLRDGQTLLGAGGTLILNGSGGQTMSKSFFGSTPTITNTSGTAIVASTGSTINSLDLSGAYIGVDINARSNVVLEDMAIGVFNPGATSRGVYVHNSSSDIALNNINVNFAMSPNSTGITIEDSSNVTMTGGRIQSVTSTVSAAYGALVISSTNVLLDGVSINTIDGNFDSLGIAHAGFISSLTLQDVVIFDLDPFSSSAGVVAGLYIGANNSTTTVNNSNFNIGGVNRIGIYTTDWGNMTVGGSGNTANVTTLYQNDPARPANVNGQIDFDSPATSVP
jgi:hypothetical protein